VMNSLPDTVYVVDIDDDHIHSTCYKNNDITMLLGYEKKSHEIVPNWFEYVTPEGLADLQAFMQRMRYAKAGTTHEHTTRLKHAQGHIVTIKFRNTPLVFDDNGEVTQYIGIGRDISEDANNQNRIAESERRYRLLAENMSDIVWETDTNVDFKFISSSIKRVLGHDSEDLLDLGPYAIFQESELRELMKETYKSIRFHKLVDYAEPAPIIRKDLMATHKNGHKILVEIKASLIWDEYKQLTGVLGVCRDVTEARNIEQQLLLASKVFENSSEAILITDNQLNIVKVNRAFTKITNYQSSEVIGKNPELLLNTGESNRDFFEQVGEHLVIDGYWQGEIQYRRKQGDIRTAWAGVSAIRDEQQEVQSLIMIMSDISDRKATEDRIHYLAFYDPLTQLPNRSQMLERLEAMLTKARQQNLWIGVLFIDLDRFKPINDSMGHPAGDRLLQLVAERLKNSVKSDDLVCRMSGDEFTIAFMESGDEASVTSTAITIGDRVLEALHRPFGLSSRDVFISASIGISIFPKDGQTVIELLKNADLAMYHAKNMGRDNLKFFTASMNRKAVQRLELENDLRQALARQEMEVYYQPQYCTKTRAIVGVEALLRWHHPTQGVIEPSVFIPIIEDTGMIVPLGEWVLKQACTHFVHWKTASKGNLLRMAVNVSGRQFGSDDFLAMVTRTLSETNMKATELELELTESILMDDVTHTLSILKELRKLGVKTAIDDFGTGYSSLNYLKQFPVDTLKIDRSFIQNLPHNDDDAQISRTIIAMGHNLGVGIVAEGVETEAQYNFLKAEHCEEVQGFYFSHPMPESELMTLFGAH
ncbi:MAG: EAL domain-containing protein, partial [Oleibacter sp.]|nr:EAL domain-containing protein [Thalassolituus sp.]